MGEGRRRTERRRIRGKDEPTEEKQEMIRGVESMLIGWDEMK